MCRGSHAILRSTAIPPGVQQQVGRMVGTQNPFLPCCTVPGHAAKAAKLKFNVAQTPSKLDFWVRQTHRATQTQSGLLPWNQFPAALAIYLLKYTFDVHVSCTVQ